jgi:hypothetical protein
MHARPSQAWKVYRNKRPAPELQPIRIEESCDGKRLDYAELILDPALAKRMEDYKPMHDVGSEIEIEAVGVGLKHVGVVTQVIPTFGPSGEVYKFISQMRPHLESGLRRIQSRRSQTVGDHSGTGTGRAWSSRCLAPLGSQ